MCNNLQYKYVSMYTGEQYTQTYALINIFERYIIYLYGDMPIYTYTHRIAA